MVSYIVKEIMAWFQEHRYAHSGLVRDVSLAEFNCKPDKAMLYVDSLAAAGKLRREGLYVRIEPLVRRDGEVFPWEK